MLKRTTLYERHVAMGARIVEFGGWEMPVQYSGILDEHTAVRNAAGLFDISHMGRFIFKGPDAERFLQYVVTCDVTGIVVGQSNYALLCHPHGGIIDDILSTTCRMSILWSSMPRIVRKTGIGSSKTLKDLI